MKFPSSLALAALLLSSTPACIFVHVSGEPGDFFDEDDEDASGFQELSAALEGCLTDPDYDLDLVINPWRTEATWTVRYSSEGSDGHEAFHRAREAVLARIEREGGRVTGEHEDGPGVWSCSFRKDGDPGKAAVRLVENADEDDERPHQLEVDWEETD